jgi:hypothetical protein
MSKNDSLIFKRYAKKRDYEVEIPTQIRDIPGIRLIKIRKDNKKRPAEKRFLHENNYSPGNLVIEGWVRGGGNYAILTGLKNDQGFTLVVFDADELKRLEELGVLEKLPDTLTVRTGGGGQHRYFWGKGIEGKQIFYDQELKDDNGEHKHLADLQHKGQYVIGPGSSHDSGRKYEIIIDLPIAQLTAVQLDNTTSCLKTKKRVKHEITITRSEAAGDSNNWRDAVRIEDICRPDNAENRGGGEIVGENPIHGHRNKKNKGKPNFAINTSKNVWSCYSCGSGGGWIEWFAVQEGIIRCEESGKGCLSKEDFKELMERARERGLLKQDNGYNYSRLEYGKQTSTQLNDANETSEKQQENAPNQSKQVKRTIIDTLPNTAPEGSCVLLEAPPREGKTHKTFSWIAQRGNGNFFTHTHAIANHVFKISKEMKCNLVVKLEGMNQPGMCINEKKKGDCDNCRYKPDQHKEGNIKHTEMVEKARKLLYREKILSKDNVPPGMCKYYTLKYAEKDANFCITVIQNINEVKRRDLEVIDEDTAMKHFFPQSIELCTIRNTRGKWGGVNNLTKLDAAFDEILIENKRKTLKRPTKTLKEMCDIIESKTTGSAEEKALLLRACLKEWEPKEKYVREEGGHGEDDITLEQCVNCLEYLNVENQISIREAAGGAKKIFLLANERYPVVNMDWWNNRVVEGKVVIIGSTIAEMFIEYVGGEIIEKENFAQEDEFVILALDLAKDEDQRGKQHTIKTRMIDIARELGKSHGQKLTKFPTLVLTGSKQSQRKVKERIKVAHESSTEGEEDQKRNFMAGITNITYQNSTISRGLDVDIYNCMIAVDTNFSQPYWSATDRDIADRIITDETTNAVLRISSTKRTISNKAKLVIMAKDDLCKVRYLHGRVIECTASAQAISRVLIKIGVTGKTEMTEHGIDITRDGTSKDNFYERLHDMILNADTILSNQEELNVGTTILNVLAEKRGKWMTTRDLQNASNCVYRTMVTVLQRLHFDKRVQHKRTGKSSYWKVENHRNQ